MLRFILIGLVLLSYSISSYAMQSVSVEDNPASSAYFNSNIEVISENINIDVSEHFGEARYTVQYDIDNKQEGIQIPLFFNLHNGTRTVEYPTTNVSIDLTIDGKAVAVQKTTSSKNEILFDGFFKNYIKEPDLDDLDIYNSENYAGNLLDYVGFVVSDLSLARSSYYSSVLQRFTFVQK